MSSTARVRCARCNKDKGVEYIQCKMCGDFRCSECFDWVRRCEACGDSWCFECKFLGAGKWISLCKECCGCVKSSANMAIDESKGSTTSSATASSSASAPAPASAPASQLPPEIVAWKAAMDALSKKHWKLVMSNPQNFLPEALLVAIRCNLFECDVCRKLLPKSLITIQVKEMGDHYHGKQEWFMCHDCVEYVKPTS